MSNTNKKNVYPYDLATNIENKNAKGDYHLMKSWLSRTVIGTFLWFIALSAQAGLVIGSWNMKHLGWNNHKNLPAVAQVMSRFDLVGLQEVMYPERLEPLVQALEAETGTQWKVTSSRAVGANGYKEGYAFIWRPEKVKHLGGDVLYIDPNHDFLRQPFSAVFEAIDGSVPAFIAATVHIKYGDNASDRTPEIRALAEYWQWLGENFEHRPRILMGDFNLRIKGKKAWRPLSKLAKPYVTYERTTLSKKPGQYAHAYDHFWVTPSIEVTRSGVVHAPEMLGISHKTAYTYISDHAPIYLTLGDAQVDLSPVKNPKISDREGSTKPKTGCIDLNKASTNRLVTLVHIGPARAKAIIAGRPWVHLSDLARIRGLSENRMADIREGGRVCDL